MNLVFDEKALVDLEGIYNWITKDNPSVARAVVERIFASTEHLATFPQMGHAGRDEVVVIAIVHGAQDRKREGP